MSLVIHNKNGYVFAKVNRWDIGKTKPNALTLKKLRLQGAIKKWVMPSKHT